MMVTFAFAGVALVVAGGRQLVRRLRSVGRFERAEGVIVDVRTRTMRSNSTGSLNATIMHVPVITFTRRSGQAETFTSEVGDGGPVSRYRIGQRIRVRYDLEREFGPMEDSWFGIWFP